MEGASCRVRHGLDLYITYIYIYIYIYLAPLYKCVYCCCLVAKWVHSLFDPLDCSP